MSLPEVREIDNTTSSVLLSGLPVSCPYWETQRSSTWMRQPEVNICGVVMQLCLVFVLRWGASLLMCLAGCTYYGLGEQKRCASALHMLHLLHELPTQQLQWRHEAAAERGYHSHGDDRPAW
jgi:hypothetical protein